MKIAVATEREVDVEELLEKLTNDAQTNKPGRMGTEVVVNKQLLRDAHDVIKFFLLTTKDGKGCNNE